MRRPWPFPKLSLNPNPTAHAHPYISPISPPYLAHILPHISPISPSYLAAGPREAESEAEKQAKQERLLKRKKSVLGAVDIDEDSGVPLGEQLKQVLLKHAGRVMDLFREWDEDGDGHITRKEFRSAMVRMGLEVPQYEVDLLFDSWDPGGDPATLCIPGCNPMYPRLQPYVTC